MGRKKQAPEVDFSTQRRFEEVQSRARNLEPVLLEDDDDDDDSNEIIVDYVTARGELQHSAPSDVALGRLVNVVLQEHYKNMPRHTKRAPGARKRPLAHSNIYLNAGGHRRGHSRSARGQTLNQEKPKKTDHAQPPNITPGQVAQLNLEQQDVRLMLLNHIC
jgi:hypothetical protein